MAGTREHKTIQNNSKRLSLQREKKSPHCLAKQRRWISVLIFQHRADDGIAYSVCVYSVKSVIRHSSGVIGSHPAQPKRYDSPTGYFHHGPTFNILCNHNNGVELCEHPSIWRAIFPCVASLHNHASSQLSRSTPKDITTTDIEFAFFVNCFLVTPKEKQLVLFTTH